MGLPKSDKPARPDELRWTITKGAGQSGAGYYMIDGPDIQRMEVMPAQVTDEMVELVAAAIDEHINTECGGVWTPEGAARAALAAAFSTQHDQGDNDV